MPLNLQLPSALDHFRCLVGQDAAFPLLEAAVSLAHDAEPALDVQSVLLEVDALLLRLQERIPSRATAMQRLYMLNEFFYEKLGFAVNANDFADPANSYIHRVLATRRGIPISLAVLWMELAVSLGLKAQGISFPGHFLVKVTVDEGIVIQDPLTGRGLTPHMLSERLEPFRQSWGLAQEEMAPLHMFLQPATGPEIIERMLRNLQSVYSAEQHKPLLLGVLQRLLVLRPDDASLYRDRGMLHAELGQPEAALQDLQTYVRMALTAADVEQVQAQIAQIQSTL